MRKSLVAGCKQACSWLWQLWSLLTVRNTSCQEESSSIPKKLAWFSRKITCRDPIAEHYADGYFVLDTNIPGNPNIGHEFKGDGAAGDGVIGRGLLDEERWDLIESLKTL